MDVLEKTINGFNELTIQSTINKSEEDDAERNPNSNAKIATYTTNRNSPHKSILNRRIPKIIPGAIRMIDQTITKDVAVTIENLDVRQTVILKEIGMDTARVFSGLLGR